MSEIRRIGRVGKGVKIMNLREGERITGVAKLVKVEGEKLPGEENAPVEAASAPEAVPAEAAAADVETAGDGESDNA